MDDGNRTIRWDFDVQNWWADIVYDDLEGLVTFDVLRWETPHVVSRIHYGEQSTAFEGKTMEECTEWLMKLRERPAEEVLMEYLL